MNLNTLIDKLESIRQNLVADGINSENVTVAIWDDNIDPDTHNTSRFEVKFAPIMQEVWFI